MTVEALPGREIDLHVEFDTDVFDAARIEALIERLRRVLVAMIADPTRRLSTVDLLDRGERDLVLSVVWCRGGGAGRGGAAVVGCGGGCRPGRGGGARRSPGACRIASLISGRRGWRGC